MSLGFKLTDLYAFSAAALVVSNCVKSDVSYKFPVECDNVNISIASEYDFPNSLRPCSLTIMIADAPSDT